MNDKVLFHILRMFWLAALAVLLACLFGWRAGWSSASQWSDGLFIAGLAQLIAGGASMMGSPLDTSGSLWMRYMARGNTAETRQQFFSDMLQKQTFGMQAFAGAIITILLAVIVSLF